MQLTRRGVMMIASVLTSMGVLTGLSAAPAAAQPHPIPHALPTTCPDGNLCLYQNIYYNVNGGSQKNFAYNAYRHDVWIYVGDGMNDQATSYVNSRVLPSAFAENKLQISGDNCGDIGGNRGNPQYTDGQGDLSAYRWENGDRMNDSTTSIMLKSSDYRVCDFLY